MGRLKRLYTSLSCSLVPSHLSAMPMSKQRYSCPLTRVLLLLDRPWTAKASGLREQQAVQLLNEHSSHMCSLQLAVRLGPWLWP